jgi:hypothetical protein
LLTNEDGDVLVTVGHIKRPGNEKPEPGTRAGKGKTRQVSGPPPRKLTPIPSSTTDKPAMIPLQDAASEDDFAGYAIVKAGQKKKEDAGDKVLYEIEEDMPEVAVVKKKDPRPISYEKDVQVAYRGEMGRYAYREMGVPTRSDNQPILRGPGVSPTAGISPTSFYSRINPPPSTRRLPPHHPASRVLPMAAGHRVPSQVQSRADGHARVVRDQHF